MRKRPAIYLLLTAHDGEPRNFLSPDSAYHGAGLRGGCRAGEDGWKGIGKVCSGSRARAATDAPARTVGGKQKGAAADYRSLPPCRPADSEGRSACDGERGHRDPSPACPRRRCANG